MFPKPSCQWPREPILAGLAARDLKLAIAAFHLEYHEYPLLDPANDVTTDSGPVLMDILLGSDAHKAPGGRNPRGIAFFIEARGASAFQDPWGNHFRVRFDTNADKQIENPEAPGTFLPKPIAIWSAGPDGDFNTWKDNVKSW